MDAIAAVANAAFERRLESSRAAPLAIALSGGGDSIALLLLAADWCGRHGRPLLALTVDHRLHPDSASWTGFAGQAATRAGAEWRALAWEGAKPATGLPAAGRAARHRLLALAAREAGARVLLVAHTADDAIEGERMRRADVPGLGRLREWGPSPAWPEGRDLFVLRPLLEARRAELRAWLKARGQAWLDDPANDDMRFARARARRLVEDAPPPADVPGGPLAGAGDFDVAGDGRFLVPRAALQGPGAGRFIAAALLCAAGTSEPPRGEPLQRLQARLSGAAPVDATLAGARVMADPQTVQFGRDAGERFRGGLAPLPLPPGVPVAWDGRFVLKAAEAGWTVAALGGLIARLSPEDRRRLKPIPAWARGALPVFVDAAGSVRLPAAGGGGPIEATSLARSRLSAACGLIAREDEIGDQHRGAVAVVTLC